MLPDSEPPPTDRSSRARTWLIVFCFAVAVRLLNIAFLPTGPEDLLKEDASLYWHGAETLLEYGSFSIESESGLLPQTERVPGYFLFLAAVRSVFGDSLTAALIAQAFLDAFTCVLIGGLAALLSPRLALPTGILAALWPNLIIHSGTILSESLFLLFFTAMLFAAGLFLKRSRPGWAALAGLTLGLAILTRPVAQLLPVAILPVAFILPLYRGQGVGAAFLAAVLFFGGAILPLTPLLHRNYEQFGTIALTSQTGAHLTGWVAPLVRRAADGTPREVGARELTAETHSRLEAENRKLAEIGDFERSRLLSQIGMDAIRRYPVWAIAKAWANGAAINLAAPALSIDTRVRALPHPSFDATPGETMIGQTVNFLSDSSGAYLLAMGIGIVFSLTFLGLQTYGVVILARLAPWGAVFALLCIAYFLLVNGPVASPKYRLPFEPILIVLSALALCDLYGRCARRSN